MARKRTAQAETEDIDALKEEIRELKRQKASRNPIGDWLATLKAPFNARDLVWLVIIVVLALSGGNMDLSLNDILYYLSSWTGS